MPSEFTPLVSAQQKVSKLSVPLRATVSAANEEYEKHTDPSAAVPTAPVYAARLNGLLKTLANAESAVAGCVKAREDLVSGLEKMLETNRSVLENDRKTAAELLRRKEEIEDKKQQVELAIMRALGPAEGNGSPQEGGSVSPPPEPGRPEMEALTPPAIEDDPADQLDGTPAPEASDGQFSTEADVEAASASGPSPQSVTIFANGSNKRRRVDGDELPYLGHDGEIDPEVTEMLKE